MFVLESVGEVVFGIGFMARPVGRGHFVFGCGFLFCVGIRLFNEIDSWM